jgi:hypothetical protein
LWAEELGQSLLEKPVDELLVALELVSGDDQKQRPGARAALERLLDLVFLVAPVEQVRQILRDG